jgi:UDP-4-amino-4,6-dideoxy-N-acetyl-beta-L-altrosamine transaminase
MIPYGRQDITQDDIDAVVRTLQSDFLTQGPAVPRFEQAVSDYCGAKHAVAASNATAALHISCLALGLGKGDLLWTSPITFVASANCALYCGADVDFVDIDPGTYNLCVKALEAKLIQAEKEGRLPKIVVPVHLCGRSCDMQSIHALSQRFGFKVVEDASHAIGGTYNGQPVGNCRYSDITVFSFHPVKIITTAEGGMAVTQDDALAERLSLLRSHGITRDPQAMTHTPDGPWYYQQVELGFNYRLTDVQAALGISQLSRIDSYVARRREIAATYRETLADLDTVLNLPAVDSDTGSSWHLFVVALAQGPEKRRPLFEHLRASGIGVQVHYIPVHLQPYYQKLGFREGMYPNAEDYYSRAFSLPLYPSMGEVKLRHCIETIRQSVEQIC